MSFKVYNPKTTVSAPRKREAFISVSGKSGMISISIAAGEKMGLSLSSCVEFLQDETKPKDWYLRLHENGFLLRQLKGREKIFCLQHSVIARDILASIKVEKNTVRMFLGDADENGLFPIITNSAK